MNKKLLVILLTVILVLLSGIIIQTLRLNQKPREYILDISANHLTIHDIHLLNYNGYLYLSPNYYLERRSDKENVSEIIIKGTINDQLVLDTAFGEKPFQKRNKIYVETSNLIKGIDISSGTILNVEITYTIGSKKETFSDEIIVNEFRTPKESVGIEY